MTEQEKYEKDIAECGVMAEPVAPLSHNGQR